MSLQARWRREMPVDQDEDEYITRREFTKFLVMISGATFLSHGFLVVRAMVRETQKLPAVDVAGVDEVPVGGVKLFRYPTPQDPAILIRVSESEWVAFTQRCTHLSCPVVYAAAQDRLTCPCHDGAFDARTGRVLKGPPPRPLPRIAVRVDGGRVWAEGMLNQDV